MTFTEEYAADSSFTVHRYSNGRHMEIIDSGNRHWAKYLEQKSAGTIVTVPYVTPPAPIPLTDEEELMKTDFDAIRLVDDLIDTLITKTTITVSDLPVAAQTLYNDRKTLRGL